MRTEKGRTFLPEARSQGSSAQDATGRVRAAWSPARIPPLHLQAKSLSVSQPGDFISELQMNKSCPCYWQCCKESQNEVLFEAKMVYFLFTY